MSAYKYPSIFSRQMENIVYIFSRQMEAIVSIFHPGSPSCIALKSKPKPRTLGASIASWIKGKVLWSWSGTSLNFSGLLLSLLSERRRRLKFRLVGDW